MFPFLLSYSHSNISRSVRSGRKTCRFSATTQVTGSRVCNQLDRLTQVLHKRDAAIHMHTLPFHSHRNPVQSHKCTSVQEYECLLTHMHQGVEVARVSLESTRTHSLRDPSSCFSKAAAAAAVTTSQSGCLIGGLFFPASALASLSSHLLY